MAVYIAGLEGGGGHSEARVLSADGRILGCSRGAGTNLYLQGVEETARRFGALVSEALKDAGLPEHTRMEAVGISSSGCEVEETNVTLRRQFLELHPRLTARCLVCSDTVGAVATAFSGGGVCLIAGTGSNSLLLNPAGDTHRCGGWSYMYGDEGSAWWIANRAVKWMFDEEDNLRAAPFSTAVMRRCICAHFSVEDRYGLLEHAYTNFSKVHFAGLCERLAAAATEGDLMCQQLFRDAGAALGSHVKALVPNVAPALLQTPGGLSIVAVGNVFLSWRFLEAGFIEEVSTCLKGFTLLQLKESLALGAAYLAADSARLSLPAKQLDNNTKTLCVWSKQQQHHNTVCLE